MIINADSSIPKVADKLFNEFTRGSSDSRHPFRYLSLATHNIDTEEPNIRMVILRKITDDWRMFIYTDARTEKVKELKKLDKAALLFWHPHHKLQVTLKGNMRLHENDETAQEFWDSDVHGPAQKAYTPIVSPGTEIEQPEMAYQWPETYDSEHFCVLECRPYLMQALQIKGKEHRRISYDWNNENNRWNGKWIAP